MPKLKEPTPQMLEFWKWYASPASPTFSNAYQSALKAGYSHTYAKGNVHRTLIPYMKKQTGILKKRDGNKELQKIDKKAQFYSELLEQAEQNIKKDLSIPDDSDKEKLQMRQKATFFTAERIGKKEWSTKDQDEKAGLVAISGDTLHKLADTLANLSSGNDEPIKAQYTVRESIDTAPAELPSAENEDE